MYRNYQRVNPIKNILDLQSIGAELRIYGEINDPNMRYFNPSIAWHRQEVDQDAYPKLKIAIRSCNFAVERHGKWYLRDGSAYSKTDVIYGDLDPITLEVSNLEKLNLSSDTPIRTKVAGLEDVRLFSRKDGMHAIGFESDRLTRSLHNASTSLAEYLINRDELKYIRTLKKPITAVVEKNWSTADMPNKSFDFTYSPTQVWKDGEVIGQKYKGIIHGGTQLIKQKDGTYLSIVHDKVIDPTLNRPNIYDKYVYRHYLARHGKDGIITHLTEPFNFGTHENIEFAGGMVEYGEDFIISAGVRDCKFILVRINRQKLIDLLQDI